MRIGLIAPPWVPVPPPRYGGTEAVIDNLARGLQQRGHDIRLFTVGESTCPVPRCQLFAGPALPMGDALTEAAHTLAGYEELADLELIHDHTAIGPLIANRQRPGRPKPPVVVTFHGSFTPVAHRVFLAISEIASIVAISHSHARQAGQVPIAAVIHHGIDLGVYRPRPQHDGFLLFMGRMSPDKGCDIAIDVAHRAGTPLRIATKMRTADEKAYFEQQVEPVLAAEDVVLVEPDLDTRCELLSAALALLNPIVWSEPFGLVMAESLASGTPVIAFPNGAAPEIVDHGITGFLCRDRDEMVRAVGRAATIDPAVCRLAAENRFSLDRMAGDYERLFRRVLAGPDTVTPPRELDQRSAAPDGNHG